MMPQVEILVFLRRQDQRVLILHFVNKSTVVSLEHLLVPKQWLVAGILLMQSLQSGFDGQVRGT